MAKALWNGRSVWRGLGSPALAGRFSLSALRTRPWLHDQYAAELRMHELPLPSFADGGYVVSLDQSAPDQVVLGHLPDRLGQGRDLGPAPVQADWRVVDHGPPDAAQDSHRRGPPGQRLSAA